MRRLCYYGDSERLKSTKIMKMTKKRLVIIIIIVLVFLAGASAFAVWQAQGGTFNLDTSKSESDKKDVPQYAPEKKQDLIDDVNQKYGNQDYKGAVELLEGQENVEDIETQLLLAGAYANSGDYQKGLDIYKKVRADGKLPEVEFANMASVAELAKDYSLAIEMYKKAKEYAISSGEENEDQVAVYDYQIAELEKKK